MKVTVSVTNDLVTDQRVHKVCTTLEKNGYEVTLVGRMLRNSMEINRSYRTVRMRLFFKRSFFFYAEYNICLFFFLLFEKTDVFLSNDTDTLPANFLASLIRRKPLILDAHEIFPEVPEIIERKQVKQFWQSIENFIFPRLKYSYTVSDSIASYYNEKYKIDMQVVRNIPMSNRDEQSIKPASPYKVNGKYILLYQGSINHGRGIEPMINAMPLLENFVFYVVGAGEKLVELKEIVKKMKLTEKVIFTGRVPFEELNAYTSNADIGINLLESWGLSYYYSLPNRVFDYISAGIPFLSSDFPEIRKIVADYNVGTLINSYDPNFLSATIKKMITKKKNRASFTLANANLSWEKESLVLLKIMNNATSQAIENK